MPVLRAKFRFAAVMPKNVFQLNQPLFIFFQPPIEKAALRPPEIKSFLKSKSNAMCNHILTHLRNILTNLPTEINLPAKMLRELQCVLVRPWTCQHVLMLVYDIFLAVLLVDDLVRLTLALRADRMTAKQIERKAIAAVPRKARARGRGSVGSSPSS